MTGAQLFRRADDLLSALALRMTCGMFMISGAAAVVWGMFETFHGRHQGLLFVLLGAILVAVSVLAALSIRSRRRRR